MNTSRVKKDTPFAIVSHLLTEEERPNLDFKSEVYKIDDNNQHIKEQAKDELIKDIIALLNTNPVYAGETSYLLIGASDDKNEEGVRDLFDIGEHNFTDARIIALVNSACEPDVQNIKCEEVVVNQKRLLLITILPTEYLHETTRILRPKKNKRFSERTAFVRRGSSNEVATQKERETIAQVKRLRYREKRNPPGGLFGTLAGGVTSGMIGYAFSKNQDKLTENNPLFIGIASGIFGGILGGSAGNIYRDFFELRSSWYKVPQNRRFPVIVGAISLILVVARSLDYLLSRILRKASR